MTTYPNRFPGKTAVMTGAAQGTGRDVALRLAREGARVTLVDRSDLVEEVRREAGAEALAVIADLEGFAGATAVPADRGSSSLSQPDEALWNNGRAGCANSVPGLGRGLLPPALPCPWQAATSAEPRRSDRFRLVIRIEGARDER